VQRWLGDLAYGASPFCHLLQFWRYVEPHSVDAHQLLHQRHELAAGIVAGGGLATTVLAPVTKALPRLAICASRKPGIAFCIQIVLDYLKPFFSKDAPCAAIFNSKICYFSLSLPLVVCSACP
jgi:hypothetical protein